MYWISSGPIVTLVKSEPASNENESYCFGADPKQMHGELLQEERDAERADERCDPRGSLLAERPIREPLDDDAEAAGAEHRSDEHERDDDRDRRDSGRRLRRAS